MRLDLLSMAYGVCIGAGLSEISDDGCRLGGILFLLAVIIYCAICQRKKLINPDNDE